MTFEEKAETLVRANARPDRDLENIAQQVCDFDQGHLIWAAMSIGTVLSSMSCPLSDLVASTRRCFNRAKSSMNQLRRNIRGARQVLSETGEELTKSG